MEPAPLRGYVAPAPSQPAAGPGSPHQAVNRLALFPDVALERYPRDFLMELHRAVLKARVLASPRPSRAFVRMPVTFEHVPVVTVSFIDGSVGRRQDDSSGWQQAVADLVVRRTCGHRDRPGVRA